MNRLELFQQIQAKESFLCVGLDTDIKKIPSYLLKEKDPVFEFNKQIIEATIDYAVAYKPNIAFYEAQGPKGWESLAKTMELIPKNVFTIADAKRGDIGNTSGLYARAFFDKESSGFDFDSITVAPYMGEDSVTPFLEFENKWVIVLALTSNPGSNDFQKLEINHKPLFQEVMEKNMQWASQDNLMFVVGATQGEAFKAIRAIAPDHFLLVPGVGAQGGDLATVAQYGLNKQCGLLVNSSRGIIYAGNDQNFAIEAGKEARKVQQEMKILLEKYL
jgi:orotidine-5'-phosphate decarboxylase